MSVGYTACTPRNAMSSFRIMSMGTSQCSRRWRSSGRPDIGAWDSERHGARNLTSKRRPAPEVTNFLLCSTCPSARSFGGSARGLSSRQYFQSRSLGGACGCHANEPVELARTHVLCAVAGKQPGLVGIHPSLLARDAPPFAQELEKVGR